MHGLSFKTYLGYHFNFFKINKYQLLYCTLQYAHAGTKLTLIKNWRFFWRKKNPVPWKSIHDLEDSFYDKSLWISINRPRLLPEMNIRYFIEGTYHRQFGKYARFSMFRSWAKILLFLSSKTFPVLIFEDIHITKSYIIKFLVNIRNHGKN